MNLLKKFLSLFQRPAKREAVLPTITLVMAINQKNQKVEKAQALLKAQAEKIAFLNPKTVLIDDIQSPADYGVFCKKRLPEVFDTDFVLIIQSDGKIINADAWTNDFFKYDYIGAPWKKSYTWMANRLKVNGLDPNNEDNYVGNGGFSLRSKKFCEYVAEHADVNDVTNEDTYLCQVMRKELESAGFKFAPCSVAKVFSVEHDEYTGQFGAHKSVIKDGQTVKVREM